MLKIFTIPLLAVSLGACTMIGDASEMIGDASETIEQFPSGTTLQKAKRTPPQTDNHGQMLYTGYVELS